VFHGLVVISTSLQGISAVAQRTHPLARDPSFTFALGDRPTLVTALVFADLGQLLSVGRQTGLSSGSLSSRLGPDLQKVAAVGLSSIRGKTDATTEISVQVR
jgi:hypothetical protein